MEKRTYNENFSLHEKLIALGCRIFAEKSKPLVLLKSKHA